ncbi:multidrug resistance efflux pump [Beggiatoa alba B18LD]|uniref:Multidrug resistance efflux pump n=2 Tax=Beggiatoa alba TaxID=1022 RepID=I3CK49_9GAMM|nr:multidrug resistance efflux pump [Beggiatoa alba B18LD]
MNFLAIALSFLLVQDSLPATLQSWWTTLTGQVNNTTNVWQGYIEGEFIWLSPTIAGQLAVVNVKKGEIVKAGTPLFTLVAEPDNLALQEAEQKLQAAQARLADAQKGLRPEELTEIKARIAQTEADLSLAQTELNRTEKLLQKQAIQQETVDINRATLQRQRARLNELQAQLNIAQLGSRNDAIRALQAEVKTVQAVVAQAHWRVAQKQMTAPIAGQITEVFHYAGEWVAMGSPVVALLPSTQIKLRFFVSETGLGELQLGQSVNFQCDGCNNSLTATISHIATEAEYTPPIIYSQETRVKLVYMIEARPSVELATQLHVGQPVSVWRLEK